MAIETVRCERTVAAPAAAVWAYARRFGAEWHPFIAWVTLEEAGRVRAFKVKGEDGLYRERLTYFSDSDMELRYAHLEGIRDVRAYRARLAVRTAGDGARIAWSAEIDADEPRALAISEGTRAVFEAGITALEEIAAQKNDVIAGEPRLAITTTAPHPGPLLLFLHGIGGNRSAWQAQLQAAAPLVQAAALDLRGYGGSGLGPRRSRAEDYCDDILRVMRALGKERVILCGLSYGSWIATSFAMRHPEKLAGLVLSGGCTGMSEAPEAERRAFLEARERPLNEGLTPADFAPAVIGAIAGPGASEALRADMTAAMAAIPASTYRDALSCFTHPEERFDFGRIACPVLLMTGEHDRLAHPDEIRAVADRIHAAGRVPVRFEIIAGAGHLCNLENPGLYNGHLCAFLESLAA